MTIRVIVNGANGKMGRETIKALSQQPAYELVGTAGRNDDLTTLIKLKHPHIVIDFTTASAGFDNAKKIITENVHPVIGTSGFLPSQVEELKRLCAEKKLGGIIAPNFSIAAVLLMQYAQNCARYFSNVEIIELHHDEKVDAPSGTALKTAEMIGAVRYKPQPKVIDKEILVGARGARHHDIPIHSIRLPGLVAHQEVIFGNTGEILTLRHDMLSRQAAMPGVILACQKVLELNELVYGLENIL